MRQKEKELQLLQKKLQDEQDNFRLKIQSEKERLATREVSFDFMFFPKNICCYFAHFYARLFPLDFNHLKFAKLRCVFFCFKKIIQKR